MPESKNHFRNLAWGCLVLTFVLLNTKDFWTGFIPSSQEKAVQGSLEDSQEYKNILDLQKAFVRNAKKIKPSVVSVNKVKELVEKSSWYNPHNHGSEPWYSTFRNWFVQNLKGRKYAIENVGSGIVLDSNGYILTNYHVIENLDRVLIKLSDGKEYFAKVLGYDTYTDLAALKISTLRRLREPEFGQA
ncbi:MAG: hypothetical protein HOF21_04620, partial [Nitrospina sp.]|nr:hypothetical protein [Nitrospina sp.]